MLKCLRLRQCQGTVIKTHYSHKITTTTTRTIVYSKLRTTTTSILRPIFPGPPGWAGARRELLDFMVPGEINRGRHTDHQAGRHSIRTNQCPPPSSPIFFTASTFSALRFVRRRPLPGARSMDPVVCNRFWKSLTPRLLHFLFGNSLVNRFTAYFFDSQKFFL